MEWRVSILHTFCTSGLHARLCLDIIISKYNVSKIKSHENGRVPYICGVIYFISKLSFHILKIIVLVYDVLVANLSIHLGM